MIALVGRPNVGKSTLFNRLLGQRKAVVLPSRGTTRDRLCGVVEWRGRALTLMDTAGFEAAPADALARRIQQHLCGAIEGADAFVLICDAREGMVPADEALMERLRAAGKPIVVAANKIDDRRIMPPEFFSLGAAETCAVSAMHGRGTGELLDVILERLPPMAPVPPIDRAPIPSFAIVGRQNVGKSSLFNALLRAERVIVSDIPGTTRDAIDSLLVVNGQPIRVIDTAGLRHRRKVTHPVDHAAMSRAIDAITRCHAALVVLDATQGVTRDDLRIIHLVCADGRGCVVIANKRDLLPEVTDRRLIELIRRAAPSAAFAPVVVASAATGLRVAESLATALRVVRAMRRGLSDERCLAILHAAWAAQPPTRFKGRAIRLHQARWLGGGPARIELTLSPVAWLPVPYQHYVLKRLYAACPMLVGIPVSFILNTRAARGAASRR